MKLLFMALDAALDSPLGPPDGLVFLFDMRLATLRHVARIRVHAIQLFCSYLQDALPVKLRTIHVLNVAWFFDRMLAWLRPFLAEALLDKVLYARANISPRSLNQSINQSTDRRSCTDDSAPVGNGRGAVLRKVRAALMPALGPGRNVAARRRAAPGDARAAPLPHKSLPSRRATEKLRPTEAVLILNGRPLFPVK